MLEKMHNNPYSTERITKKQKEKGDFQWYKAKADYYENLAATRRTTGTNGISEYDRIKSNMDLYNNVISLKDFEYVCKPYGLSLDQLPAKLTNKDISSYRIKALEGMEMKLPFNYRLTAVNKEATTRKEEEETNRIRQYVIDSIMQPIRLNAQKEAFAKLNGVQPSQEQIAEIQKEIEQTIQNNTPERIKKYMKRDHQDPAEVLGNHLLNFQKNRLNLKDGFSKGWKYALLSAYEIYYIGMINNRPCFKVVNPLRFNCDLSSDLTYIQEGAWAVAEYRKHLHEVANEFELTDKEYKELQDDYENSLSIFNSGGDFYTDERITEEEYNTISVKHIVFRGQRKIGWLTYQDLQTGEIHKKFLVDEEYKLNEEIGDIEVIWEWVNENYEVWKIGTKMYKNMQPIPGQFLDEKNVRFPSPLPYYGGIYDRDNSVPTCPMDRVKMYQFLTNIIHLKVELLMSSDEGKKILTNINMIPTESGVDMKKWKYFFKTSPFMWYNNLEEGMQGQDVNTVAKVLDLSLISDIQKYIDYAEYLDKRCGIAIGVTDPVLGQTSVSERVSNNQQNLIQTGHILEPYFNYHNSIKKEVLKGILDITRICYAGEEEELLSYVLDDMSLEMFKTNPDLLLESRYGLFMEDGVAAKEIKDSLEMISQAAMQNQKLEMSEFIKIVRTDDIQEAEEQLAAAEELRRERETKAEEMKHKNTMELEKVKEENAEKQHKREIDKIVTKEEERRKTVIQQQAMLSTGFNEEKDMDNDGKLDVMEIAQQGIKAEIEMSKQRREDIALSHQIKIDNEKLNIEREALQKKVNTQK